MMQDGPSHVEAPGAIKAGRLWREVKGKDASHGQVQKQARASAGAPRRAHSRRPVKVGGLGATGQEGNLPSERDD